MENRPRYSKIPISTNLSSNGIVKESVFDPRIATQVTPSGKIPVLTLSKRRVEYGIDDRSFKRIVHQKKLSSFDERAPAKRRGCDIDIPCYRFLPKPPPTKRPIKNERLIPLKRKEVRRHVHSPIENRCKLPLIEHGEGVLKSQIPILKKSSTKQSTKMEETLPPATITFTSVFEGFFPLIVEHLKKSRQQKQKNEQCNEAFIHTPNPPTEPRPSKSNHKRRLTFSDPLEQPKSSFPDSKLTIRSCLRNKSINKSIYFPPVSSRRLKAPIAWTIPNTPPSSKTRTSTLIPPKPNMIPHPPQQPRSPTQKLRRRAPHSIKDIVQLNIDEDDNNKDTSLNNPHILGYIDSLCMKVAHGIPLNSITLPSPISNEEKKAALKPSVAWTIDIDSPTIKKPIAWTVDFQEDKKRYNQ